MQIKGNADAPPSFDARQAVRRIGMVGDNMSEVVVVKGQSNYSIAAAMVALLCAGSHVGFASAQTSHPPAIVELCTPCHGIDGTGGDVEKPNLAGQKSIYIREQLLAFRSGKRKHPDMKLIGRHLSDREIDQLVVYYSTLPPN
jgi:cytochrome c553